MSYVFFVRRPFPFWTYLQSHLWSRLLEILAGHSEFGSAYFENRYMRRRGCNTKRVVIPTLCQHLDSISEKLMTSGSMYIKNGCPNIVNANATRFFFVNARSLCRCHQNMHSIGLFFADSEP